MSKPDINRWMFFIPAADVQDERSPGLLIEPAIACFCCGKETKEPRYFVHLLTTGELVSTDEPFDDKVDQGFFPIGAECRKRLPNNFYFTSTENK